MPAALYGMHDWACERDRDGHRDYSLRWLIQSNDKNDGPTTILLASGLPGIGTTWRFGNDVDSWAFCWPDTRVSPVLTGEPNYWWMADQHFSTRPLRRCQNSPIENPLVEPPKIGGSFTKFTKEAFIDRHGNIIESSSHEPFKGALAEWDDNRPNLWIEQNYINIDLALIASSIDTVNDHDIYGLRSRMLKLSNVTWSRVLFASCSFYFTVRYEFDINFNTFDRKLVDKGFKKLPAGIDPDEVDSETGKPYLDNPDNFELATDRSGNPVEILLDGKGRPLTDGADPFLIPVEYYPETNMDLFNLPASLAG